MEVVNWSGAVFGPGSEWLWAFLQFVVVVVSLLGIYRQLRLQGAANSIALTQSLEQQWASPQMTYSRIELLERLRAGRLDPATFGIALDILGFFTVVSRLERSGAIGIEAVTEDWGEAVATWATLLDPVLRAAGLPADVNDLSPLVSRVRRHAARKGWDLHAAETIALEQRIAWARRDLSRDYAIARHEMPPAPGTVPEPG